MKLKTAFEELKRKIADKNHYIQKAEYDKKDLEVSHHEMALRLRDLEKDLLRMKE